MQLLSGLDLKTGEVAFGARTDPEGNTARGIAEFQVIHNQTGLAGAVDIQPGLRAFDRDAIAGPDARLEVHVAFVLCLQRRDFRIADPFRTSRRSPTTFTIEL